MAYSFTEPSDDSETNNTPIMVKLLFCAATCVVRHICSHITLGSQNF